MRRRLGGAISARVRPERAGLGGPAEPAPGAPPRAVLVPGAAPHRPAKRWPVERFAALAASLAADGLTPVVVGAAADAPLGALIAARAPGTRDLTGRTDLPGLARALAGARVAVGNDTGPMHLAASLGVPSVVLFSAESDPRLTAPRGPAPVRILGAASLDELAPDTVVAAVRAFEDPSACPTHDPASVLDREGPEEHLDNRADAVSRPAALRH